MKLAGRNGSQADSLTVGIGPFSVKVSSRIPSVVAGLTRLYGHYPRPDNDFFDFHVAIEAGDGVRRWWRPQVNFSFDGVRPFKPLPASQALPLFEWGMNWCITAHCHEYLIIHAAVVEKNGRVLMLSAPPGAGKSTLCAALVCRGWRLLSDELALVSLDGQRRVTPVARPVCLKNRSIEVIGHFGPRAEIGPICYDTAKGAVAHMLAPADSVERIAEVGELSWVVFPRYLSGVGTSLTERDKPAAFMELARQSFNLNVLGPKGVNVLQQALQDCPCYDFQYSSLDEAVALFDELQEQRI